MVYINGIFSKNFIQTDLEPQGVGVLKKPFVNFDSLIDTSDFDRLHEEVMLGLATIDQNYMTWGKFSGSFPSDKGMYEDVIIEDEYLTSPDLSEKEVNLFKTMKKQEIRKYLYFSKGILKPWAFTVYLKTSPFNEKTKNNITWDPPADNFPMIKQFVEKLPFESVGRVMFFCTDAFRDVPVHRDDYPKKHADHSINIFFNGWRPSYIYNPKTNEKIYLEEGCRSYVFNNRDYHGVDTENKFRYTLRVDGTFTKEIIKKIGLYEDGSIMI